MSERNDRDERTSERRAAEGVRIIGPEEAQAALDAGQAAGRRAEDELRFGDVPPAPSGPRPPHRFPLPDSVDPAAAVPRPPIVQVPRDVPAPQARHRSTVSAEAAHDPRPWQERSAQAPADEPGPEAGAADPPAAQEPAPQVAAPPLAELPDPAPTVLLPQAVDPALADTGPVPLSETPGATQPAGEWGLGAAPDPTAGGYQGPWSERPWSGRPAPYAAPATSGWTPPPDLPPARPPASPDLGRSDAAPPDEGINVTGGFGTELPHWTDPPTGEVPRIRPEPVGGEDSPDDLAAWEALGARGTRWRDDSTGWDEVDELDDLADDEALVGALDQTRSEHSDLYSFDEEFERLEEERSGAHRAIVDDFEDVPEVDEEPVVVGVGSGRASRSAAPRTRRPPTGRPPGTGRGNDLGSRAAVGVGLVVLLAIAYAVGPLALLVLATAIVAAAAVEVYGMLQHSGFRPATLLGLVATVGVMFAAYWRGTGAVTLVVGLVFVVTMLWYLMGIVEARPLANAAVTLIAFLWVGVLGSFAALLLRAPHGKGLFVGAVLPAVAADIVAYFVGRRVGSRLLAPSVSPAKTLEGVLGGAVAAVIVGLVVGHSVSPWGGTKHGLLLGLVVAVLAPIGDLFESMIKRDLAVKDSGSALAGHGGVLDRFDSVLLVLPAAFYLASLFNVVR